jgi:Ca-activated chloride channel family protein
MMILGAKKILWPVFLLGVLAIFISVPTARAQGTKDLPPPPPLWKPKPTPTPKPAEPDVIDKGDVITTNSNLVMVPVSVTDPTGQAVQGLKVADFRLEEEGKQQEISGIGDPEQVPLAIALLFDISSSTSQKGFFASQQNAAAAFLRLVMKPKDQAAIFTITGKSTMVQPLASAETSAAKMASIPAATTSVPTAFYDTVIAAAKYLTTAPSNYRRVIVVLSDGDDNFSEQIRDQSLADYRATTGGQQQALGTRTGLVNAHQRAVANVQKAVQQADAIFYSVNPGGPSIKLNLIAMRAERGMEAIAETTGGTAFVPDSDQDLDRVFRTVAAELRGQYLLQYYANADAPAGQFRRITVAVPARNDLRVRSRQGYYPKKQD